MFPSWQRTVCQWCGPNPLEMWNFTRWKWMAGRGSAARRTSRLKVWPLDAPTPSRSSQRCLMGRIWAPVPQSPPSQVSWRDEQHQSRADASTLSLKTWIHILRSRASRGDRTECFWKHQQLHVAQLEAAGGRGHGLQSGGQEEPEVRTFAMTPSRWDEPVTVTRNFKSLFEWFICGHSEMMISGH